MTRRAAFFNGESVDSPTSKAHLENVPYQPKILFVTTVPITLTSFLIPLAQRLVSTGARVDCASMQASTYPGLSLFSNCFDISWNRSLTSMAHYATCEKQLTALLDKECYDIVHVHTPIAAYITRKACHKWKLQHNSPKPSIIYTVHGFHFYAGQQSQIKQAIFKSLEKHALPWTNALVVMNDEDEKAAQMLRKTSPSTDIVRINGIGFDFSHFKTYRTERLREEAHQSKPPTKETPTRLCIIAEHNRNKDIGLLFEALAILKHRNIAPFHLTVVGSGPLTEDLKTRATTLKIDDCTLFTGQLQRPELDRIIKNSDIGVLVSQREGLPRSLMEFCAAGVTIAGTKTRGIIDEVRDSRALASKRTPESVANMLQPLIENPRLRQSIAHNQYEYALKTYDLPLILDEYEALYRHYLSGSNR